MGIPLSMIADETNHRTAPGSGTISGDGLFMANQASQHTTTVP
jgi:hypothetical protein